MSKTKVKFCGFTNTDDVKQALDLDIDLIGLVFVESSPRYIKLKEAEAICKLCEKKIKTVGVFMNNSEEFITKVIDRTNIDLLQFHGQESLEMCVNFNKPYIKTVHVDDKPLDDEINLYENHPLQPNFFSYLLDTKTNHIEGGTGIQFNWNSIIDYKKNLHLQDNHIFIAGGLDSSNIKKLILDYNPLGIDVSSGIEFSKGKKSPSLMKKFIENVRIADSEKSKKK